MDGKVIFHVRVKSLPERQGLVGVVAPWTFHLRHLDQLYLIIKLIVFLAKHCEGRDPRTQRVSNKCTLHIRIECQVCDLIFREKYPPLQKYFYLLFFI